jgi:hypothetical protein
MVQDTEQGHLVYLQLLEKPNARVLPALRGYLRAFCRAQGYIMTKFTIEAGRLRFEIKPAPEPSEKHREFQRTSERNPPSQ